MSNYPRWRYHKTLPGKIVQSAAEDAALGKGWADSPAAFEEKAEQKADQPDKEEPKKEEKEQKSSKHKSKE